MKEVGCSFDSACKRAGIYNFHFHDLRHSAASFMAMSGIDLLSIGKILGHLGLSHPEDQRPPPREVRQQHRHARR